MGQRNKKKKKKLFAAIAAGSLLVLAAGYTVFIAPLLEEEQWVYKEEIVERGTLKVGVTESGSLEYGITSILYDLNLDVGDEDSEGADEGEEETRQKYLKIDEVYVAVGQRIKEGDVLIRFTPDSIMDVRSLLESAAVDALAEYEAAELEYNLSALEAGADYESRKLEQEYAEAIYQNASRAIDNEIEEIQMEINQRTANIAALQKKAEEAAEDYSEALAVYQEAEKPAVEGYSTVNFMTMQKEYLNIETRYENAKSRLDSARQELDDNARQIEELRRELEAARARQDIDKLGAEKACQESVISGENAQVNYNAQMESLKETLEEAKAEKEKVQAQLEAFEAFVGEDGCLYAGESGIVTEVAYRAGDRLQRAGTMVSYAAPEDMTISVDVTQEDIVDLKVGDKVDITFHAYGDTSYGGSIQSINTTAVSQNSNTVSYTVVIAVEGDTALLYGGMTADIIFVKEQKEDVLYISRKAVVKENGKTYVYQKSLSGSMELKEVEAGISNGIDIEILSGLKEGDAVYLASRVSAEEDVKGESGNTGKGEENFGGFTMPEGMEWPEGMGRPGSFGMPEGMQLPEGFGRPGGRTP